MILFQSRRSLKDMVKKLRVVNRKLRKELEEKKKQSYANDFRNQKQLTNKRRENLELLNRLSSLTKSTERERLNQLDYKTKYYQLITSIKINEKWI